jgi:hypothetical protein
MRERLGVVLFSAVTMIVSYGYAMPALADPCDCNQMYAWCVQDCNGHDPAFFYCDDPGNCQYTCGCSS